jgi:delta 1-pyrroline-5-carboxylate dehydrogenase
VQPFGGRGLSGTGPKAGGPLYLGRLVERAPVPPQLSSVETDPAAKARHPRGDARPGARVRERPLALNRAAFNHHVTMPHHLEYDERSRPMVRRKLVRFFSLLGPSGD